MLKNQFLSTSELAKILGISRIAVFNRIKKGQIKAEKIGRNYIIHRDEVIHIIGNTLSDKDKAQIDKAVKKTVEEFGETLELLGNT